MMDACFATLQALAPQMKGKVVFTKIDTEKYPDIAGRFNISALPTLVLFKDGKPIDRVEGVLNEQQLKERLNYFLQTNR